MTLKRSTVYLGGRAVHALEEKGRANEGAAGGAAEEDRARESWKTIGAVAADIVARCQRSRYQMTCAN